MADQYGCIESLQQCAAHPSRPEVPPLIPTRPHRNSQKLGKTTRKGDLANREVAPTETLPTSIHAAAPHVPALYALLYPDSTV